MERQGAMRSDRLIIAAFASRIASAQGLAPGAGARLGELAGAAL